VDVLPKTMVSFGARISNARRARDFAERECARVAGKTSDEARSEERR
jgi:hypothetical protein